MKIFKQDIKFDTNLFEALTTLGFMVFGVIFGFLHMPNNVPINIFSYLAMSSLLGFVVGFTVSNVLVWVYKEIKKK